jgi:hypothetical protein
LRKKIRRCTQHYFKTKFLELIIHFFFMKYITVMKIIWKQTYILKCKDKLTWINPLKIPSRQKKTHFLHRMQMEVTPPLSILSLLCWNLELIAQIRVLVSLVAMTFLSREAYFPTLRASISLNQMRYALYNHKVLQYLRAVHWVKTIILYQWTLHLSIIHWAVLMKTKSLYLKRNKEKLQKYLIKY